MGPRPWWAAFFVCAKFFRKLFFHEVRMGAGRPSDTKAVREAKGDPSRHKSVRKRTRDKSTTKKLGNMPKQLAKNARGVWSQLAPDLERLGFLRDTDRLTFMRYCEHLTHWCKLTRELNKKGFTQKTKSKHVTMVRMHPKFVVRERIETRLETLEDRFGLNPAHRQIILQRMAGLLTRPEDQPGQQGHLPIDDQNQPHDSTAPAAQATEPPSPFGALKDTGPAVH
jgi:P27 family predicted phage terminase small subunit